MIQIIVSRVRVRVSSVTFTPWFVLGGIAFLQNPGSRLTHSQTSDTTSKKYY